MESRGLEGHSVQDTMERVDVEKRVALCVCVCLRTLLKFPIGTATHPPHLDPSVQKKIPHPSTITKIQMYSFFKIPTIQTMFPT